MNQKPSSNRTQIIVVASLLGVGILALIGIFAYLFRGNIMLLVAPATPTQAIAPTVLVPTVTCEPQTFVLSAVTFHIQNLTLAADGSLTLPPSTSGVAYEFDSTEGNYLFLLSPTPENISLKTTLTAENTAKIIGADCSSRTFDISAPESNTVNVSALPNQLTSGLTIFFQTDTSGNGIVVRGDLTERTFP